MPTLAPAQKHLLNRCSRTAIEQHFKDVASLVRRGRWTRPLNRYLINTIGRVREDSKPGGRLRGRPHNKDHADLGQYIAASAPLHYIDGWSFLARAAEAHNHADPDAARHLAYYAELRAAMSLLAGDGIGIFSNRHYVVTGYGQCELLPRGVDDNGSPIFLGTHTAIWPVLDYWSGLSACGQLLSSVIVPAGTPLREWVRAFAGGYLQSTMARRWMRVWGVDLKRLSSDHDARNEASYRPNSLRPTPALGVSESLNVLADLWNCCQPSPRSPFDLLDRYLLRLTLEDLHYQRTRGRPSADTATFRASVKRMLGDIAPIEAYPKQWLDLLVGAAGAQPPILLRQARGTAPPSAPEHHVQVISRAVLLLRLAAGSCSELLQGSGASREDLGFWLEPFGTRRGLWRSEFDRSFRELWDDVEQALTDLRLWLGTTPSSANPPPSEPSRVDLRENAATALAVLANCERIGLWGLAL